MLFTITLKDCFLIGERKKSLFKLNELIQSGRQDDHISNLDSEEMRLISCYALCKLGKKFLDLVS